MYYKFKVILLIMLILISFIILPGCSKSGEGGLTDSFERPPEGDTLDYNIRTISIEGEKVLETTSIDHINNLEFYRKMFGLGKYAEPGRVDPIIPKDIEYKPDTKTKEMGYPKIYGDKDINVYDLTKE